MQSHYKETRRISDEVFDSIFMIIAFFLGQSSGQFEVQRVKNVFQLIRFFSNKFPPLWQELHSSSEISLAERADLKDRLVSFVRDFNNLLDSQGIKGNGGVRININALLSKLLTVEDESEKQTYLFSSLGGMIKRMLVGGNPEEMSLAEYIALLEKLPEAILVLKDFNYFNGEMVLSKAQEERLYYKIFTVLPSLLHDGFEQDEVVVPHDRLPLIFQYIYPEYELKFNAFEEYIVFVKKRFFNNPQKDWTYDDITKLSRWGQVIFGSAYFNSLTYSYYHAQSEAEIVLGQNPPPLKEYSAFSAQDLVLHWENFKSIVTGYRYFKNNFTGQTFQKKEPDESIDYSGVLTTLFYAGLNDYKEQDEGKPRVTIELLDVLLKQSASEDYPNNLEKPIIQILNQISLVKIVISKLVDIYSKNGVLKKEQLAVFLKEVSPLLKSFDIDMGVSDEAVTNLFNQIDFLQFQSNGNSIADIEEITELVTSLFFARRLAAEYYFDIAQHCPLEQDVQTGQAFFKTECYRERFMRKFFQERNHRMYFNGLLDDPIMMKDPQKRKSYFLQIENISRKDKSDEIKMDKQGLVRMMLVFFSMEGMCDRLDRDANGVIDTKEVAKVYPVFKNFISEKLGEAPWVLRWEDRERLLKSIFLYIIKEQRMPESADFVYFHTVKLRLRRWNDIDHVSASREDVINIINVLLE